MLIDYLRYVAFAGRLRSFFTERYLEFVDEPSDVTGQHLRFSFDTSERSLWPEYTRYDHQYVALGFGVKQYPAHVQRSGFKLGSPPPTFPYTGQSPTKWGVEVLIDIVPDRWRGYSQREEVSYEGFPIRFRPAGFARGQVGSGEKLYTGASDKSKFGTLCGFFSSVESGSFGLTCGHVAGNKKVSLLADRRRKFWKFDLGSAMEPIGHTAYIADLSEFRTASARQPRSLVTSRLDAALIALDPQISAEIRTRREASGAIGFPPCVSVLEMLQETKVGFRGAGRPSPTAARISGVTVWKSIDLYGDGVMHEIGDVLMIGHPRKTYLSRSVSRPGDSGSAIMGWENDADWYGMLLGADEEATYASYAEQIWDWAAIQISDQYLDFYI
ncbi:hypothetical protein [Paraburkholderia sp. DHOC27]|uniref:hypothetical protein n=1 Tax=Paraburkholderia sp. DHOC27 TaxID=2303330 RepID=UPI000E3C8748|nr:hypothetical protein [Paraburkholderia sp. DHOC27]RFU47353.1 hypothetical protein D0B32_14630 [Paraburkholderia sp. DHOC27]